MGTYGTTAKPIDPIKIADQEAKHARIESWLLHNMDPNSFRQFETS